MKAITAANWLRLLARCAVVVATCSIFSARAQLPIYVQVSSGDGHSCAVRTAGSVHCWGQGGAYGLLGNDATHNSPVPVSVRGISTAAEVRIGLFHACARLYDGSVRCWGRGTGGALGQGSFTNSRVPVSMTGYGPGTPAKQIAVGAEHTCVLSQSGQVACTGGNSWGQSGRQGNNDVNEVVAVPLPAADEIVAGEYHTCARTGGTVWCWGQNTSGQLGNSSTSNNYNPVQAYAITSAIAIAAGRSHSCALLAAGGVLINSTVSCWGDNGTGQLGYGVSGGINPTPTNVVSLGSASATPSGIAAGNQHSCARLTDATVQCWGNNLNGALGDGTTLGSSIPVYVADLPQAVSGINAATAGMSAGNNTSCVIMTNGSLRCWGSNEFGEGGHGQGYNYLTTPQYVAAPGCALDFDGDGEAKFATDGLLLTRALSLRSGAGVTQGALGAGATRTTWNAVLGQLSGPCGLTMLVP